MSETFALPDDLIATFVELFEDVRDKQFAIGDLLNSVIETHGASKAQVINYLAGTLNVSASTLYDYARVSEAWTLEHRAMYQSLDWTVYRNTNPTDPDDIALLELCIDEGWSASRLKREKYPQSESDLTALLLSVINRLKASEFVSLQSLGDLLTPIVTGWLNKDAATDQK